MRTNKLRREKQLFVSSLPCYGHLGSGQADRDAKRKEDTRAEVVIGRRLTAIDRNTRRRRRKGAAEILGKCLGKGEKERNRRRQDGDASLLLVLTRLRHGVYTQRM